MVHTESCTRDEKQDAFNKAMHSQTFARSEQLRSFLRYVCEAEFGGVTTGLSEYRIGVEVLHRPVDYSPSEDSSVRTRAYELRQKLEKLYSAELPNELIRIIVPKGSYSPRFVRIAQERVAVPANSISAVSSGPEKRQETRPAANWHRYSFVALTALIAGLTGAALALALVKRGPAVPEAVVLEAWKPFSNRNNGALLMAATPLYLVLGPASHQAYGTATYPAPPEAYPLFREHRPLSSDARLGMIFTHDALGVGSMNAVLITSNVIRSLGGAAQILPERPDMMSVLHGRNVVLFGAPVDSQAIAETLEKTPLSVVYDESIKEFIVKDQLTGQRFAPEKETNGDFRFVYGLITVLNTRESDHDRLGLIVFSGITSVGTHGAAEYFASPRALKALRAIFAHEGVAGFPAAYQVIVKCRFENMLLVSAEYHAHRILRRD